MVNRQRNQNKKRGGASRRLTHVVHQVNKIEPFLVRKNAQLMSVPSHKETGLNMERFFRLHLPNAPMTSDLTIAALYNLVLSELGIATSSEPYDMTLKELRVYSNTSISGRFFYRTGNQDERNMVVSDYVNQAGLSCLDVVYPVASRLSFTSGANTALILQVFRATPAATVNETDFIIVDALIRVSSRGIAFAPALNVSNMDLD